MATWLKKWGYMPEKVQDFYPTPGTISTVMYHTGINPMTGKSVYVPKDYHEKQLQRALLQYSKPENANLVREALRLAEREDLIGNTPECLVRPSFSGGRYQPDNQKNRKSAASKNKTKNSKNHGKNQSRSPQIVYAPAKAKKKTKFDRVFGEDADRIRREADRLAGSSSSAKNRSAGKRQAGPSSNKKSSYKKK